MREIRERDRLLNSDNYPRLHYPEIYLLEGGYKNFFENHNVSIFRNFDSIQLILAFNIFIYVIFFFKLILVTVSTSILSSHAP